MKTSYFLVCRWGNPRSPEGYDGKDTIFLVQARNHNSADAMVEKYLERHEEEHFNKRPNMIVFLGKCEYPSDRESIMQGPYHDYFSFPDSFPGKILVRENWDKRWHK